MDPVSRLMQEADHCYEWSNGPGATYQEHAHPYRKILYVTHGSITFTPQGNAPMTMKPGDRIEIPAGTPHGALVGAQGVTCWEGQAKAKTAPGAGALRRSPEEF
jgi:Cupin domain